MLFVGLPRDTVGTPEWGLRKIHEGQLGRSLCGPPPPPWSSLEHQGRAPHRGRGSGRPWAVKWGPYSTPPQLPPFGLFVMS